MIFSGFPQNDTPVPDHQVCILGLRSVDQAEKTALQKSEIQFYDMRAIDEQGIKRPLQAFLDQVKALALRFKMRDARRDLRFGSCDLRGHLVTSEAASGSCTKPKSQKRRSKDERASGM